MHRPVPSIGRIVVTDYWAFLSLVAIAVTWVLYVAIVFFDLMPNARGYDPLMRESGAPFFFWFAVAGAFLGVPALFYRVSLIRGVFERGEEAEGEIAVVWFFKDRGRAEYVYEYRGREYRSANPLHKTARTRALQEGQAVTVVVDPDKPDRAFIGQIYLD